MRTKERLTRLFRQQPPTAMIQRVAGIGVAVMLTAAGAAVAQETPGSPVPTPGTQMSIPDGYTAHHSVDLGGRMSEQSGSEAMYSTMVNQQSGPRVLGESFQMHALPGNKHPLADSLSAFGSGFGGDPYNFAKLDAHKGKVYEFHGLFRRDRQYFDYDLLGNPAIPGGQSIPVSGSSTPFAWQQVVQSPFLFNTVRRMTDTQLTLLPLSTVSYHVGYSHNTFEGPTLSPSGYQIAGSYSILVSQYYRNSTDDFLGGIDWKPVHGTTLTFEEQVDHYKADTSFSPDPAYFRVQEADGTLVAPLYTYFNATPGISCPKGITALSAPQGPGGLPVINAACAVLSGYQRTQPTRIVYPTEIFRLQSASVKNVTMNGNLRYTNARMDLPNYYDSFQGLNGATRSMTFTGTASAHRAVAAADYGIVWQATRTFSLSDQVDFSNAQQPGMAVMTSGTTLSTPATSATINYSGPFIATKASSPAGSPSIGNPAYGFFGQRFLTNNLTATWDASGKTTLSLSYHHGEHVIALRTTGSVTDGPDKVTINDDGAILAAAVRLAHNWDVNGSVEVFYADNAFTPMSPRQTKQYRLHTIYKPRPWATLTGVFNDRERHNNTNNTAGEGLAYFGPLNHVDSFRIASFAAVLAPNEHYGLDLNYSYTDVYTATNECYTSGAGPGYPGTATLTANGTPAVCPGVFPAHSTTLADWLARSFEDAPTQYGSVGLHLNPSDKVKTSLGYRVSAVDGTRFYSDARDVAGSLVSTYQSPYVDLAYAMRPSLTWKAEYNFYGYGEGGPSGAQLCSLSTSFTATVAPCSSFPYPTGQTEPSSGLTAPRNFHANNVVLGVHYEF